jgi:hypothetical protein
LCWLVFHRLCAEIHLRQREVAVGVEGCEKLYEFSICGESCSLCAVVKFYHRLCRDYGSLPGRDAREIYRVLICMSPVFLCWLLAGVYSCKRSAWEVCLYPLYSQSAKSSSHKIIHPGLTLLIFPVLLWLPMATTLTPAFATIISPGDTT